MKQLKNRKIILPDGQTFFGTSFGAEEETILELVFNTSMAGYQEILSDPSYTDQAVVMTYPLIGNYGMAAEDYESDAPSVGALIVRDYNDAPSHYRSEETLGSVMRRYGIAGITGVDTRRLNRSIRDRGSPVARVGCKAAYQRGNAEAKYHVVAVDCGMKKNILRSLVGKGCRITVVPWNTTAEDILALKPDGVFLSNGPGDPTDVPETVHTVQALLGKAPIFGICLGHQILSLAYGAKTYKLKFGHRGGNHPVKNLRTGKIEITSQNHSYAVDADSLSATPLCVTHINLLDSTVEGVACGRDRAMGVQYHPESAPGPQDSAYLFDDFIRLMKEGN